VTETPETTRSIRSRDRGPLLDALRNGVVPHRGASLIQVGRARELEALQTSIEQIKHGAGAVRFVIGDYGAGKTFFLHVVRSLAHKNKLVTVHADLTPDRRLQGSQGRARKLYSTLMANMATRAKPGGQALTSVVEQFVAQVQRDAEASGTTAEEQLSKRLWGLREFPGGPSFAKVVQAYWHAYINQDEELRAHALRWLSAEYAKKTEATRDLGVSEIIDDRSLFDHLKLMAAFTTMAGYRGLLVCLDELVNLYKLSHKGSRVANYEQILNIINDTQQGRAEHIGFLFGGTPEFLEDPMRGLYSYEALRSRLEENPYATGGLVDYHGPVLRLSHFTKEHFYELLRKVRHVYAGGDPARYPLPDEAIEAFMQHCAERVGDAYFRTPRSTIKQFIGLMDVLVQNEDADWRALLSTVEIVKEANPDLQPLRPEDDVDNDSPLASFRL
jgi:Protein of unknown function (DUF2791).